MKSWMKLRGLGWAGLAAVLIFPVAPVWAQTGDPNANPVNTDPGQQMQVLAVVNGQQITRQQLANECLRRYGNDVLESIVNKILVWNECQRRGVVITEKDVNDEINLKARSFDMTGEKWIQLICSRKNISVDQLKNDIIWQQLALQRLAAENLEVTPEELDKQIEFEFGPKVQVREIVTDSREKAEQLLAMARQNPTQFGDLAKEYSLNPTSQAMKGLLPAIAKHSGAPLEMENLIFGMQPGQISDVVQISDQQFVILQCERIFPGMELTPQDLATVKEKLIDKISEMKLADAAAALFVRLQETVKVENVINDPALSQQYPGVAARVDGKEITLRYLAEECIARFAVDMLEVEVNRTLLLQALKQVGKQVSQEDITREIARAAESFGYLKADGQVDVDGWLNYTTNNDPKKVDFYIEDEVWPTCALKKLIEGQVQVTSEDLQKGYEANFGPQVEALAIVLNDHRQAMRVWNMANSNKTEEFFGKLANQYSVEPASQSNFGQVPPIQKHGGRPELEKEAFGLKPGELSQIVQVGEHFVILMCLGQTAPAVTELADVEASLRADILEKKMRIAMNNTFLQLRDDAQIDNFLLGTSQTSRAERAAAAPR